MISDIFSLNENMLDNKVLLLSLTSTTVTTTLRSHNKWWCGNHR